MCDKDYCMAVEIIPINDVGDTLYLHYRETSQSPFFIQFVRGSDRDIISFEPGNPGEVLEK